MFHRVRGIVTLATVLLSLSVASCGKEDVAAPDTASELDSPYLLGASTGSANFIHAFGSEGNYRYRCRLHTSAHFREGGMVFVTADGPDSTFVRIFEGKFRPESTTVRRGGQVRWQNFDDGTNHTITSD